MLRHFYLYIALFLLLPSTLRAGDYSISRRISSADGLTNDFVTEIAVDGYGYVWTAGEAGVNRIAGGMCQTFLVNHWPPVGNFMQLTDNVRRLPWQSDSWVFGVKITALKWHKPTEQMFIGTEHGLIVYSPKRETVRFMRADEGLEPFGIEDVVDGGNGVWLFYSNGSVQYMDCATCKFTSVKHRTAYHASCGEHDANGHIYIGHSKDGMTEVDLKTGRERRFLHKEGDDTSLPGNNVRCILRDHNNRLWVATDGGVALFHPTNGTFTLVTDGSRRHDNAYNIHQMRDGMLWVATDMGGIRVLNPDQPFTGGTMRFETVTVQTSSVNTRDVAQDEYGNIWIGNHSTGIDFIASRAREFSLLSTAGVETGAAQPTYSVTADGHGGLLVAGPTGLSLWRDGHVAKKWSIAGGAQGGEIYARTLLSMSDGSVWMGVDDHGVMRFDPVTGRAQDIVLPGGAGLDVHALSEHPRGRVWIGSEAGVYSYTEQGGAVREEKMSKLASGAIVTCFLWLSDDVVLLTTYGMGVFTLNTRTGKSVSLNTDGGLPSTRINQAVSDGKGGVWLATHFGLAHVADAMTLSGVTTCTPMQGLAEGYVCALTADASGRVWMSTYSGVSCFDSKTNRIYNYNHLDLGSACGFYSGGIASDKDGIYLCSTSGLVHFNPKSLSSREHVSEAQIITCEAYAPEGSDTKILLLAADDDGVCRTDYSQNTLRISFCVRNQAQSPHVEYSYMMKGMDDKWYYNGSDNDVAFRGLPPGNYTFVLRAKLKSQDWTDASTCEMRIRIAPPLWRTWWAYILYVLALAFVAYTIIHSYKQRLKLRARLELERREARQEQHANEERLRFFTNITHELRTPLTLILGPLDDAIQEASSQGWQSVGRRLETIRSNAERLRALISDLLEFRKTETHNRRLSVARGDIGRFVEEICLNFKELNRNPHVLFEYDVQHGLPAVYFDSEVITTILNNLLSNAVKYTERGSIVTTVRSEQGRVVIVVADTGYGISPEALPHVFERYYQADGEHQASGTGIGLALAKSLADLHKATLTAESTEGRGSVFTLTLNTAETYPDALHKEDENSVDGNENEDENENGNLVNENENEDENENGNTVGEDGNESEDENSNILLIVEDNADIREYIADSFSADFVILQAENGEEGLRVAIERMPDIIVSDIMMPRMDGIKMTEALKNDIRTSHIPVILLTAKVTDRDKETGYDSGADSYLTKPFTANLLGKRIRNLLAARRRLAEYLTSHKGTGHQDEAPSSWEKAGEMFINRLDEVIQQNIKQENLSLPFIASEMAMSHSTFYRKVKALTGMTAKEYVRKVRLRYCRELIESGRYNVNQAAMMAGFNQMTHFRQVFKEEFGMLPSEAKKDGK